MLTINQAVEAINGNQIIILDTDTIPGLSCNLATQEKLRAFKEKPADAKFCVLISDLKQVPLCSRARELLIASCGQTTIITDFPFGIRLTNSQQLKEIIDQTGPVVTTSINKHNMPAITNCKTAHQVFQLPYFELPRRRTPSRIIKLNPFEIIR